MVSHVSFIDLGKLLKRNSPDFLNNQVVFPSINFGWEGNFVTSVINAKRILSVYDLT